MYSAHNQAPSPANSPSPLPLKNKVIMQRQYREKQGDYISALRNAIKQLTGEELETQTRQEVLRKEAIGLLSSILETRKQETAQVIHPNVPTPYEMPIAKPQDAKLAHLGYSTQSSHSPQPLLEADFNEQGKAYHYAAQSPGQQHHSVPNVHPAFDLARYQGLI